MGRDKSRLRLGPRTILGHVRSSAQSLGWPIHVLRRDLVPRCGPLGGIYSGLVQSRAAQVLFLSCDMPFVPPNFLRRLVRMTQNQPAPVFTLKNNWFGFPLLLPANVHPLIERLRCEGKFSLQTLAEASNAIPCPIEDQETAHFLNVNTPEDFLQARLFWKQLQG